MANPNTNPPVRQPSGATTDFPWGPFADNGNGNPAFYHQLFDDFDASLTTSFWTVSKTSTGTVAHTPGDGGLALFTTAATNADNVSIQTPAASFAITAGKKLFFETRVSLSDITASAFQLGLIQTTSTPATVTDGLYFQKSAGSTVINFISVVGSVPTSVVVPLGGIANYANGSTFDLAFYLNRKGEIAIFAGSQLIGWIPESGTGAQTLTPTGAVARLIPTTLTAVNLNATLALQAGAVAVKTMTVDLVCVAKER